MWDTPVKAAVIIGLTTLAKKLGIKGHWAMLLAVILGILIDIAELAVIYSQSLWQITPGVITQAIWHGLINGLTAAGLWDIGGRISPTETPRETKGKHSL